MLRTDTNNAPLGAKASVSTPTEFAESTNSWVCRLGNTDHGRAEFLGVTVLGYTYLWRNYGFVGKYPYAGYKLRNEYPW